MTWWQIGLAIITTAALSFFIGVAISIPRQLGVDDDPTVGPRDPGDPQW